MLDDIIDNLAMFLIGFYPQGPIGGLVVNILLMIAAMISGFILGLLLAMGRISKNKLLSKIVTFIIETTRALPLLLVVFWFYFLIPLLAEKPMPVLLSAYISLTFYSAVNQAEIFRGGLEGIDKGQWQASFSTGLSHYQGIVYIILPQVLKMMLPSFAGFAISLFKDTSVVYIIGMIDITQIGIMLSQREPEKLIFSYFMIAFLYFIVCFALSKFSEKCLTKYSAPVQK
jgi:His/Glu/Gln/Arg/opine family amino acid ABC transporter permease subunit